MSAAPDPTPDPRQSISSFYRFASQEFGEDLRTRCLLLAAGGTLEMYEAVLQRFMALSDMWCGHAPGEVSNVRIGMEHVRKTAFLLCEAAIQDRENPPKP